MYKTSKIALLGFVLVLFSGAGLFACNLAGVTYVECTPGNGDTVEVEIQLCVGGGVTGAAKGADSDTRTIMLAFYSANTSFELLNYSPSSITGSYTGCTMPALQVGPIGSPFYSEENLAFVDPGYYGSQPCLSTPFQCVSSNAGCGGITSQCVTITFTTTTLPDSLRVFGVEGAGNPFAGCYANSDMAIDFTSEGCISGARWQSVDAEDAGASVEVTWDMAAQNDILYLGIERSADGENFEEIGQTQVFGGSHSVQEYSFHDVSPLQGRNFYRIAQHSISGETSYSPVAKAFFGELDQFQIVSLGPNPFSDRLSINFVTENAMPLQFELMDASGRNVAKFVHAANAGENVIELATEQYAPGTYFLRIQGEGISKTRKLLKL